MIIPDASLVVLLKPRPPESWPATAERETQRRYRSPDGKQGRRVYYSHQVFLQQTFIQASLAQLARAQVSYVIYDRDNPVILRSQVRALQGAKIFT